MLVRSPGSDGRRSCACRFRGDRISADGPALRMSARSVVMLAMVLQELATNAGKYGALSTPNGRVALEWQQAEQTGVPWFTLQWNEIDGPAVVKSGRTGFGSTLIEQGVAAQLGGKATLTFAPDGLACTATWPVR